MRENARKELEDSIRQSGELLIRKASELAADVENEQVQSLHIAIDWDASTYPTVDISKTYYPFEKED